MRMKKVLDLAGDDHTASSHLAHWGYRVVGADEDLGASDVQNQPLVVVTKNLGLVPPSEASEWLIFMSIDLETLRAIVGAEGGKEQAISKLADHLALINELTLWGASMVTSAEELRRGLEESWSSPPTDLQVSADLACLRMYRTLPIPVGADAFWGGDVFAYTLKQEPYGGDLEVDLCGRARILVHGPGFVLPPGRWRIELRFEIDTEGRATHLRFDWGAGLNAVTHQQVIEAAGQYVVELVYEWTEIAPAEMRIWVERAVLHGRLSVTGAHLAKVP